MDKIISNIGELIERAKVIAIITHKDPDGDAIGSALALYHYLRQKGHQVGVIVPNEYPEYLHWMPENDVIIRYDSHKKRAKKFLEQCELIICVDFNNISRLEDLGADISSAKQQIPKILIDHHPEMEFFTKHFLVDAHCGATAVLIYELIVKLNDANLINKDIAECLYTGMMTDTICFSNSATNSRLLRCSAELLEKGVQHEKLHQLVYENFSADRMRLLGYCLYEKMRILANYHTAYISINRQELKRFKFKHGDAEDIVNLPLSIKNINLSAIFIEFKNHIKISFRSKGEIDVNLLAKRYFNGGGHKNASGGKSLVSLNETIEKFERILPEIMKYTNNEPRIWWD